MYTSRKYLCILLLLATHQLAYSSTQINIDFNNNSSPIFVSLGRDCEPALILRTLNLRSEAYPFDWNNTTQFSGICDMIKNNFENFLNPLFLKHNGSTVLHTHYTIEFRHDFPSLTPSGDTGIVDLDASWQPYYGGLVVNNFLDFLPIITEKYTRRINRFIELLNSTKNIVFIRTHLTPEEAKQFVTLMDTHYPNLKYQLIGLQSNKNIITDFQQIPSVKVYYTETKHSHNGGWLQQQEWQTIIADIISNNKQP